MTLPLFNIGGLASGLDTNAIINSLIEVERLPILRLEARKSAFELKDAAWGDINTRLSALRTATKPLDALTDFAAFVSAVSSNEAAVGVTVSGGAVLGSTSFTVDQLAANHQIASGDFVSADDLVGAGSFTVTVDGTDHTITTSGSTTLGDVAQQVNALGVGVGAAVVQVDASTAKLILTAQESGAASAFTTSSSLPGLDSFAVMQQGVDAELTLGTGPGALTVSRSSNTVSDLIAGTTLDLKGVTAAPVTVTVTRDVDSAVDAVRLFVDELNAALTTIASYTAYNAESETAGPLAGDSTARRITSDLRLAVSGHVSELSSVYAHASSVGISLSRQGTFEFDESKLRAAFEDDFDAVAGLLSRTGAADARLDFVSSTAATADGAYEVIVTQAVSNAEVTGTKYKKPSADTTFQIIVDSQTIDVTVAKNDNIAESLNKINAALVAAGATTLTATQVTLPSGSDAIRLADSRIGSAYSFQVVGDPFGLAGTFTGSDVAGTIGGEAATGVGQLLIADAGDPTGLVVRVTAAQAEVDGAGGSLSLGDVVVTNGFVGQAGLALDVAEGAGGSIARARAVWQNQIDLIDDRIEVFEDRVDRKEALLIRQFAALETAMAALTSQSTFLAAQLTGLTPGGAQ